MVIEAGIKNEHVTSCNLELVYIAKCRTRSKSVAKAASKSPPNHLGIVIERSTPSLFGTRFDS